MSLKFRLIGKCYQDATNIDADDADFLIEEDGWNDYSFHVLYHLHATDRLTNNGNVYLGYIKIMKMGQDMYEFFQLRSELGKELLFDALPEGFVSLTTSVELYQPLFRLLKAEQRHEFAERVSTF